MIERKPVNRPHFLLLLTLLRSPFLQTMIEFQNRPFTGLFFAIFCKSLGLNNCSRSITSGKRSQAGALSLSTI